MTVRRAGSFRRARNASGLLSELDGFRTPWLGFALLVRRAPFTRNRGGGRGWPGPLWRVVGSVEESGPLPGKSTAGVGWASSAGKGATGPGNGRAEPNEGRKGAPLGRSARRTRERRGSGPSRFPEGTRPTTRVQDLGREESRGVWGPPPAAAADLLPRGGPACHHAAGRCLGRSSGRVSGTPGDRHRLA